MSDLERRLEELFMSDSRARRVDQVTVARRRGTTLAPAAFIGAVALAAVAAIVVLNTLRPPAGEDNAAANPSASASESASATARPTSASSAPTAISTPNATETSGASATPGASSVRPDAAHGLITFTSLRTEADPLSVQSPGQFARAAQTDFIAAVSPDGKRVAMFRAGETGQQLITFTTAHPNDITTYSGALTGSEYAIDIIWAGDGSDYIIYSVDVRPATGLVTYSAIREYDLSAKKMS